MIEFIVMPENLAFAVSLAVIALIAILEGACLIIGIGFVGFLDTIVPGDGLEVEIEGPDLESANSLGRLFSWLRYKTVPLIITLIVFLTSFGLVGLVLQSISLSFLNFLLPSFIAIAVSFFVSLPVTRIINSFLIRIMPADETNAVSLDSLVGRLAVIYQGKAKRNSPAQAKVKDENGKTHYVMIEPEDKGVTLKKGVEILLTRRVKSRFFGILNINKILSDY